jgi:hypothetical protein
MIEQKFLAAEHGPINILDGLTALGFRSLFERG